jgi:hypothetical protein
MDVLDILPDSATLTSFESTFIFPKVKDLRLRVSSETRHLRKRRIFPFPTFLLHVGTLLLAPRRRLRIGSKLQGPKVKHHAR